MSILQAILNLTEFMEHDKEGLPIDISSLGDLAERCMAYAKALYYREREFETASEKTIESLITLYTNLGQPEAAAGSLALFILRAAGVREEADEYIAEVDVVRKAVEVGRRA